MTRVLTVKAVLWLIFSHLKNMIHVQLYMADKAIITCRCLAKLSWSLLLRALYSLEFSSFTWGESVTIQQCSVSIFFHRGWIIISAFHICSFFCCHFLFRCSCWISSHHLSVAWKPKTAPKHYVRLNDVNWNLVATSLLHVLGNSSYQTNRNMT